MSGEPQGDQSGLMRAGVRARVARLGRATGSGARRWSPPVLLAVLSAGAFGPLLASGVGVAALASAGIGAVTAVGGNVLTDVVKAGVARLGEDGGEPSREDLETELERRIQQVLEAGGEHAERLRGEIAQVLREVGAVGAAIEAVVQTGDRQLQTQLATGLAAVSEEFAEFDFVLADLGGQLRLIREGVDRQSAELQVAVGLQYRQATDTRLLLDQVAAIERRTRPDGTPGIGAGTRWAEGSPYRGLVPFSEDDTEVFYGRELVTAQLVSTLSQRLTGPGLLAVTGASGAGKSSLLRAGLIPAISRGELSEQACHWPRHVLDQPTGSPLTRLATLLAGLAGVDAPTVVDRMAADPRHAALLARQAVDTDARRRDLPSQIAAGSRLVLVVDQFEEIFVSDSDQDAAERAAFITALHTAATTPSGTGGAPAALVVIAVRGDFIDRCADHPDLASALQDGPFVLGPMTDTDLRRAITGPADAAGLDLEPGLVDTILSELRSPAGRYDAGALPLLSQTMLTVWEHRDGNQLTRRGYARTGGVTHAVATSADAVYTALTARQQDLARQVFQQLTAVSPTGTLTRRTLDRTSLYADHTGEEHADLDHVLEAFARARLIVIDADSAQIAHEVLLQAWPPLRDWLETDLTGHVLYSQLRDDADDWNRNQRAASYLYRGEQLTAVRNAQIRWRTDPDRYPALGQTEQDFLTASTHAQTRNNRRRRLVMAALMVLAVVATAMSVFADAERAKVSAHLDRAVARSLVSRADALRIADPRTAMLLNAAAWRIGPKELETHAGLRDALTHPVTEAFKPPGSDAETVYALSTTGSTLVGVKGGVARLWDVASGQQVREVPRLGTDVYQAALNRDGTLLAVRGEWSVRLWSTVTGRPVGEPIAVEHYLYRPLTEDLVRFSADGRFLGVPRASGLVWIDLRTRAQVHAPQGGGAVDALAPDGRFGTVHLADPDPKTDATPVEVWDLVARKRHPLEGLSDLDSVTHALFTADGHTFAAVQDGEVHLWNLATRRKLLTNSEYTTLVPDELDDLSLSPNGGLLAIRSPNEIVIRWITDTAETAHLPIATDTNEPLSFSPDGRTQRVLGVDGTVLTLGLASPAPDTEPEPDDYGTASLADNARIAAVVDKDRLMVREVTTGRTLWSLTALNRLEGLEAYGCLCAVAISPDATKIALGGYLKLPGNSLKEIEVAVLDATDGSVLKVFPLKQQASVVGVSNLTFSHDGSVLAVGPSQLGDEPLPPADYASLELWRWQAGSGTVLTQVGNAQAAFSPDDTTMITSTGAVVEVSSGRRLRQLSSEVKGQLGGVSQGSVASSPDGTLAAIAGPNGVTLWDTRTWQPTGARLTGQRLSSLVFSPDGHTLAASTLAGLQVWDVATGLPLGTPTPGDNGDLQFDSFSGLLHTFTPNGTLHTTLISPERMLPAICARAGRTLSPQEWHRHIPELVYQNVCPLTPTPAHG